MYRLDYSAHDRPAVEKILRRLGIRVASEAQVERLPDGKERWDTLASEGVGRGPFFLAMLEVPGGLEMLDKVTEALSSKCQHGYRIQLWAEWGNDADSSPLLPKLGAALGGCFEQANSGGSMGGNHPEAH